MRLPLVGIVSAVVALPACSASPMGPLGLAGTYHLVALDSTGSPDFSGTMTISPRNDSDVVISFRYEAQRYTCAGSGTVHRDTLAMYFCATTASAVELSGAVSATTITGAWGNANPFWTQHGAFTATRELSGGL